MDITSFFFISSSALSNTCPPNLDLYRDLVAWNRISVTESEPILNSLTAWIETKKGKFDCEIKFLNTQSILLKLNCDNQSTITKYYSDASPGIYVTDANNSQFKMQEKPTEYKIYCFEDTVVEQQITEAFQEAFQFKIVLEYQFQRRKTLPPVGF
ncbi:MAG: hypothetical protein Tsb0014_11110 [Pleurocapsa sp.]